MKTVHASGDRFQVGYEIGESLRSDIQACLAQCKATPPEGFPLPSIARWIRESWAITNAKYPDLCDTLVGIADGAGVSFADYYYSLCEELWDGSQSKFGGCTDVVAMGSSTLAGRTLLGHTNDLMVGDKCSLVKIDPYEGVGSYFFSTGGKPSVGFNNHGLVISGNAVYATDLRVGVPRLVLLLAALECSTIEAALSVILDENRASSYNSVLADSQGRVVTVEASGTRHSITKPTGLYAHSNHYLADNLREIEIPVTAFRQASTLARKKTADRLLLERDGHHTVTSFLGILASHEGDTLAICRHGKEDISTLFAVIFQPESSRLAFCDGNPCKGDFRTLSYGSTSKLAKTLDLKNKLQETAYSCGTAAVRTVLDSVGVKVTEKLLRKVLETTYTDGTRIPAITGFFRRLMGVKVLGAEIDMPALKEAVKAGHLVIVCWQSGDTPELSELDAGDWENAWEDGHYSIVSEIQKGKITLTDPAQRKPNTFTLEDFETRWHDMDMKRKYERYAIQIQVTDKEALIKSATKVLKSYE